MTDPADPKTARSRLVRIGAGIGVALGLLCASLPPEYHHVCGVVTQIAGLTCGTSIGH